MQGSTASMRSQCALLIKLFKAADLVVRVKEDVDDTLDIYRAEVVADDHPNVVFTEPISKVFQHLDIFLSKESYQIPRYRTLNQDFRAVAVNTLVCYWDPLSWLFPPVPLIPLSLEGVQ